MHYQIIYYIEIFFYFEMFQSVLIQSRFIKAGKGLTWWRTRVTQPCVTLEWLLPKPRSFSNLSAFSDLNDIFFSRISKFQVKKLSCLLYLTRVNNLVRFSKSMPLVREVNHINRIAFAPLQLPITTWRVSAILIITYSQPLKPSIEP